MGFVEKKKTPGKVEKKKKIMGFLHSVFNTCIQFMKSLKLSFKETNSYAFSRGIKLLLIDNNYFCQKY